MAEEFNPARWCRQADGTDDGTDEVHHMALGKQIKKRERREAIQREVYDTLAGIGMVVMVLIVLGADSWIERLL